MEMTKERQKWIRKIKEQVAVVDALGIKKLTLSLTDRRYNYFIDNSIEMGVAFFDPNSNNDKEYFIMIPNTLNRDKMIEALRQAGFWCGYDATTIDIDWSE
ncbi:hypothetical protein ACWA5Z_06875 [Testudinibacter sp. P80/BLE/0925]